MRPMLRPGCHVLRRARGDLQVGLDPRHAVVLPDEPETRSSLALLARCADEEEYDARLTLDALGSCGLLLDAESLLPLIPVRGRAPGGRAGVAAVARRTGDGAPALLEARSRCRVEIVAFADMADGEMTAELTRGLEAAGVPVAKASSSSAAGRVVALVGVGEPPRERTDEWMRAGVPHLLVRLTEGSACVGPFVVPGRTACLRCVDAHHTDADASWPLLVTQYAAASSSDRADGVPEPVDSLLARLALAWAGRDLASFGEGLIPSTWSTTVRLDPQLTSIETRAWLRHPACGCAWA
jgi:bacteriocin biosynthesis cyclodehydratase domain-containing protein